MELNEITPILLSFNEESNIARALDKLTWAKEVVVIDSFSTDRTREIAEGYKNVSFYTREFDCHSRQWNFGLGQVRTDWALTLDADYICTVAFQAELASLKPDLSVYFAAFVYSVLGRPLYTSLYPPRAVLFKPCECRYVDDGHTQLLDYGSCEAGMLRAKLLHDDRKGIEPWMHSQFKYAKLEAAKLRVASPLGWKDRIRTSIFLAPWLTMLYCLLVKGLLFQGLPGWYYTMQRVFAELVLSLLLLDRKLRKDVCGTKIDKSELDN